jgi:hypothetical protein
MSKAAAQGMGGLLKYYDRTAAWPAALNIVETGMAAPSSTRRVVHERAQRRCESCTAMNDAAIVSKVVIQKQRQLSRSSIRAVRSGRITLSGMPLVCASLGAHPQDVRRP